MKSSFQNQIWIKEPWWKDLHWGRFCKIGKKEQTKFFRSYRKVLSLSSASCTLQWVISLNFLEPCKIKAQSVVRSIMNIWEDTKSGIRGKTKSKKGDVKTERRDTEKLQMFSKKMKWKITMNLMWWDQGLGQHLEYSATSFYLTCWVLGEEYFAKRQDEWNFVFKPKRKKLVLKAKD